MEDKITQITNIEQFMELYKKHSASSSKFKDYMICGFEIDEKAIPILSGLSFKYSTVKHVTFRNLVIDACFFTNTRFDQCQFVNCKLISTMFRHCHFSMSQFDSSNLTCILFNNSEFFNSTFKLCQFNEYCKMNDDFIYGTHIIFLEHCTYSDENVKIEFNRSTIDIIGQLVYSDDLSALKHLDLSYACISKINSSQKVIHIGPIGSRDGYTCYIPCIDFIQCGCFTGTLDEFEDRVSKTYPVVTYPKFREEYMGAIQLFRIARKYYLKETGK